MNRIAAIARLQTLGRRDALFWPPMIMTLSFVTNLAVFASIADVPIDNPVSGGLASIYIVALVFGAIAVTQQLPFAMGLGVTRREFTAGLGLFVLGQTVAYSALLVLLQWVETLTGGWGLRLRFFGLGFFDEHAVPVQFAMYAAPLLCMTLIGTAVGALFVRWRTNGILAATAGLLLLLGGTAALIGHWHAWTSVGHWLTRTGPIALLTGWPLLVAALLAAATWLTLRRATP